MLLSSKASNLQLFKGNQTAEAARSRNTVVVQITNTHTVSPHTYIYTQTHTDTQDSSLLQQMKVFPASAYVTSY